MRSKPPPSTQPQQHQRKAVSISDKVEIQRQPEEVCSTKYTDMNYVKCAMDFKVCTRSCTLEPTAVIFLLECILQSTVTNFVHTRFFSKPISEQIPPPSCQGQGASSFAGACTVRCQRTSGFRCIWHRRRGQGQDAIKWFSVSHVPHSLTWTQGPIFDFSFSVP